MPRQPIADRIRPTNLSEMVGQEHLFGKNGVIRKVLEREHLTNMIFYGPPGTGKTSLAGIISKISGMQLYKLNATTAGTADIKEVIAKTNTMFSRADGILLYIDEIQYFTKKQQQVLLEYIENGEITLLASTTENPYMYIYNAILSRSMVFEFKPLLPREIVPALERGLAILNKDCEEERSASKDVLLHIAGSGAGDVRRSLNILESAYYAADKEITTELVDSFTPEALGNFDKAGTVHYDLLSCLQKSVRGSDPDAAIFYLAKILEGGDLLGACRRLQVMASEDIGLAYPMAVSIVGSAVDSALRLGMPEASIPLSTVTIMLANCPKSNSAHIAYENAKADVLAGKGQEIPPHLRPSDNFVGYKYPHDYENHYVEQQYLPNDIRYKKYYTPGENKAETAAKEYWKNIKGK